MLTETIGIIGTGNIGSALVRKLGERGFELVIHDRDRAVAEALAGPRVRVENDARAVADAAEVVLVCLASTASSLAVAEAAAGGAALRHWIEISTLPPSVMERIAAIMSAHGAGVADAPVSGGPRAIMDGKLTAIMSGPSATVEVARRVLSICSGDILVVGEKVGAAQMCKLVNNAISLGILALTSEAVVAGVKAGLDPAMLLRVINAGTGMSAASRDKFPAAILPRSFDYGGRLGMAPKDLNAYLDEARRHGAPSPLVAAAEQIWQAAIAVRGPEVDFTEIVRLFESWSGIEVDGRAGVEKPEGAGKSSDA